MSQIFTVENALPQTIDNVLDLLRLGHKQFVAEHLVQLNVRGLAGDFVAFSLLRLLSTGWVRAPGLTVHISLNVDCRRRGVLLEQLLNLVGVQDAESLADFVVLALLTHQLASLISVGRILQHLRACHLARLLLIVTVLRAEKAFSGEHAFPAARLLQIVVIDEVVVKVVEAIIIILPCLLLLAVRALRQLLRLLLLFGGLLHVTSIFLHRRKRVVVLDTCDHGLDERVEAVALGAIATRHRVRVVFIESGEVLSVGLVAFYAELWCFLLHLLPCAGDFRVN